MPYPTRRAAVHVDARELARFLELPEGVEVLAVIAQNDPVGFKVIVTGDVVPVAVPDAEAPYAHRLINLAEDGTRTVTYLWPGGFVA